MKAATTAPAEADRPIELLIELSPIGSIPYTCSDCQQPIRDRIYLAGSTSGGIYCCVTCAARGENAAADASGRARPRLRIVKKLISTCDLTCDRCGRAIPWGGDYITFARGGGIYCGDDCAKAVAAELRIE